MIARELTKRFETYRRGTLGQLAASPGTVKGELVLLVEGASLDEPSSAQDLEALVAEVKALKLSPSAAAKWLRARSSLTRQEAYALLRADS